MIEKEKIMKSIECCLRPDNTNLCGECSYKNVAYDCKHALIKDVYELLKGYKAETEKLIGFINGFSKDAVPVIRCKNCKHWSAEKINDFNICRQWINAGVKNFATMGDWFCADGERKNL